MVLGALQGYEGKFVGEYVNATVPEMAFGEYWDTCSYADGVLSYNQDAHRQRAVDWCDATGATCAAFDFTLKGILQEAVMRKEYWRLADSQGKPSGMLGLWPSRAVTFLENHDTGSTLQHWPFPWHHVAEGCACQMLLSFCMHFVTLHILSCGGTLTSVRFELQVRLYPDPPRHPLHLLRPLLL